MDNSANRHIFSQIRPVFGLFAKQPLAGFVKTRLTPPLTPEQACRLYRVALQETVARLRSSGFAVHICYAGDADWFARAFPDLPRVAQHGESLGERMTNAVQELFAAGAGHVLLSGSDHPDIPLELIRQAVALLRDADVVTVPCQDGGYAIVGLRRPTTDVFNDIPWSTGQVVETTRQCCREMGLSYAETSGWYDLDELSDLRLLLARSPESLTARHVVAELAQLL